MSCPNCGHIIKPDIGLAWRNDRWRMYNQICKLDELPPKLRLLIEKYSMAFDDDFWYERSSRPPATTVSKMPLWQPTKYEFNSNVENPNKQEDKTQKKLLPLISQE